MEDSIWEKELFQFNLNSLLSSPVMHISGSCEKSGFLTCRQETSFCNEPCHPSHITELQNHRIAGVQRDLQRLIGPIVLLKHGHQRLTVQDHVQMALEYLQRFTVHNTSGQCQCPVRLKIKRFGQMEPPVFHFVPILSLWFCHWASLKEPASVFFTSSLQIFI